MFFYKAGLGLLLPVSVGVLALVDNEHLVREALAQSDLDDLALEVNESEAHRTQMLKAQRKGLKAVSSQYHEIFTARAQGMVDRAKKGDLSFGGSRQANQPGVTRVRPSAPPAAAGLPAGPQPSFALPQPQPPRPFPQPMAPQPPLQGQVSPASPQHSGNTHTLILGQQPAGFGSPPTVHRRP
jgi:hypothetical protein